MAQEGECEAHLSIIPLSARFFVALRMIWWGPNVHPGASLIFSGIIGNFGALCLRMVVADYAELGGMGERMPEALISGSKAHRLQGFAEGFQAVNDIRLRHGAQVPDADNFSFELAQASAHNHAVL